jgi:hypothetical protein
MARRRRYSLYPSVYVAMFFILTTAIACKECSAESERTAHWKRVADERAASLAVADRALTELDRERADKKSELYQCRTTVAMLQASLASCAEATTKRVYLEQVKRNCTIANNRLIRLAKRDL